MSSNVTSTPRRGPFHVSLDDLDLGRAGLQEGAEALEDDDVVVDKGDPDGRRHGLTLRAGPAAS